MRRADRDRDVSCTDTAHAREGMVHNTGSIAPPMFFGDNFVMVNEMQTDFWVLGACERCVFAACHGFDVTLEEKTLL